MFTIRYTGCCRRSPGVEPGDQFVGADDALDDVAACEGGAGATVQPSAVVVGEAVGVAAGAGNAVVGVIVVVAGVVDGDVAGGTVQPTTVVVSGAAVVVGGWTVL